MSGPNPVGDYLKKIQQATRNSKAPKPPPGSAGAAAGVVLLIGAGLLFNSALFNVDGGHRAIKYKRLTGVGKEIYNEGMFCSAPPSAECCYDQTER